MDGRSYYGTEREDQHAGAILRNLCRCTYCAPFIVSRATKPFQPERLSRALDRHSTTLARPTAYGLALYMSCFRTVLVICFCLVSVLRANPTHRIGELDYVPVSQPLHELSSQITTSKTNGKLCSSSDRLCKLHRETRVFRRRDLQSRLGLPAPPTPPLRPRAPNPSSSMSPGIRIASFVQTTALVPGALAASKLEDFYTIIATKIETGYFADWPPSKTVAFWRWDFELIFSSDKINVPLSFVQAFAIDMAEWSSRQFTGFYEATVVGEGPLSGLVIFVQMRLRGNGRGSLFHK